MDQNKQNVNKSENYNANARKDIVDNSVNPLGALLPLFVIVTIMLILSAYTMVQKRTIVREIEQVIASMSEYVAENIGHEFDFGLSSIKLASISVAEAMTSKELKNPAEVIEPLIEGTPFNYIEYIRADGMNVMNISEPFDASNRVYYTEGIKGKTGIWNNYHPKTTDDNLVNFYTPVIYEGEISGVITGYIEANNRLSSIFEKQLYGQPIYCAMFDESDKVICSTVTEEYVPDMTLDMLLEQLKVSGKQKLKIIDSITIAEDTSRPYLDKNGEGRMCTTRVPGTAWKVAILVPASSFNTIVNSSIQSAVTAMTIISLVLMAYAAYVIIRNLKRKKLIALENARLEEENRIYNEENQKVIARITEIGDIIASANMGTWRIETFDGQQPRMYADDTMKKLLGIGDNDETPEEVYTSWYSRITEEAVDSVTKSVSRMQQGYFDENTYLWNHPTKGIRYVRCGGTAFKTDGGIVLRGYHYDVDDVVREDMAKVEMLRATLDKKNEFDSVLRHLGGIFYSMHVIDLVNDTFTAFSAHNIVKEMGEVPKDAAQTMKRVMYATITDEYLEEALRFTDLTTVAKRMGNKKNISRQFLGKNIGWILADFITVEEDEKRRPTKVIFTTRNIDEEKRHEEELVEWSSTDELTGLLNRRSYEEELSEIDNNPGKEFVYVSIDANGLKVINDSLGHLAGDEMLRGVCECMNKTLGYYGNLYRTGGDEFVAILRCSAKKAESLLSDFDDALLNWSGEEVKKISASYGFISNKDNPELSTRELAAIADERMYESKANHYKKLGIDRRGQKDAHKALCDLFTKILKINVSDDTFQIIDMDFAEQTEEMGYADSISAWFKGFGESGHVHPDDLKDYLRLTDLDYIREYFAGNKTSLHIFYRRKYGDIFKRVMMEIIPATDYTPDNQSLFLYVKDIDR